jgi:hypothetical protein
LNQLQQQFLQDFSSTVTSSASQPYSGAPRLRGIPRANRLLKAIARSGFDAVLCADVYKLYVKRNISRGGLHSSWQFISTSSMLAVIQQLLTVASLCSQSWLEFNFFFPQCSYILYCSIFWSFYLLTSLFLVKLLHSIGEMQRSWQVIVSNRNIGELLWWRNVKGAKCTIRWRDVRCCNPTTCNVVSCISRRIVWVSILKSESYHFPPRRRIRIFRQVWNLGVLVLDWGAGSSVFVPGGQAFPFLSITYPGLIVSLSWKFLEE